MTTSAAEKQSNPYNVQVGQVWESTDQRTPGRQVKVTHVGVARADVVAHAPATNDSGGFRMGRRTDIRLDRFRPGSTGWKLVSA